MDEHSYEWTPWWWHLWQKHIKVLQNCTLHILCTLNVPNPFNPTIWSKLIDLKWTLSYKKLSHIPKRICLNLGLSKGYHQGKLDCTLLYLLYITIFYLKSPTSNVLSFNNTMWLHKRVHHSLLLPSNVVVSTLNILHEYRREG